MARLQDFYRRVLAGFVIASFTASSIALFSAPLQPRVVVPHRHVPQRLANPIAFSEPEVERSLIDALRMKDRNLLSVIFLKNSLVASPLQVSSPALYLGNGTKIPLAPIKLEAAGVAVVSIGQSLADNGIAPNAALSV
jgi:hypothetical protein